MDFLFTKQQEMVRKVVSEFAKNEVEPGADDRDLTGEFPEDIVRKMAGLGMMGIPYPKEYGGAGGDYISYILAVEELSKVCASTGVILSAHTSLCCYPISKWGTEEQKKKYMIPCCQGKHIASFAFTEPQTGSDPKQITTTAVKDGDYYILNGTKRFISNANFPGPIIIFARDSESGKPSGLIVDKWCEGYSISEPWDKIGMHGGMLLDVYLKDVRVPAGNLLAGPGMGYPILQMGISFGKVGVSATALGGMLAAYEESLKYAKEKMHRDGPIVRFQAVQLRIADLAMKYEAARWMTYRLGWMANNVKDPRQFAKEAAMTKTFVAETMVDVARIAMDIHGSYGLMNDYKVARIWKDCIIAPQIEGVSDMQKMIITGVTLADK